MQGRACTCQKGNNRYRSYPPTPPATVASVSLDTARSDPMTYRRGENYAYCQTLV